MNVCVCVCVCARVRARARFNRFWIFIKFDQFYNFN